MSRYTVGYEDLSVGSSAVGFTAATYGSATRARVRVLDAAVRVRVDGVDPTASVGELFKPGEEFRVEHSAGLSKFSAIRASSQDATLQVVYDTPSPSNDTGFIERLRGSNGSVFANDSGEVADIFGTYQTVTLASGEALSGVVDLRGYLGGLRLHMPDAWTAADIGFKEAPTEDGTFNPLYDGSGSVIKVSADADRVIRVEVKDLYGARFVKLWSQSGGSDVNQDAEREIVVAKA
jgi:hypothetical protein